MLHINRKSVYHHPQRLDEEVPQDLSAFFVHPLNDGVRSNSASVALLHEYHNLLAISAYPNQSESAKSEPDDNSRVFTKPFSTGGEQFLSHATKEKEDFDNFAKNTHLSDPEIGASTEGLSELIRKDSIDNVNSDASPLEMPFTDLNNDPLTSLVTDEIQRAITPDYSGGNSSVTVDSVTLDYPTSPHHVGALHVPSNCDSATQSDQDLTELLATVPVADSANQYYHENGPQSWASDSDIGMQDTFLSDTILSPGAMSSGGSAEQSPSPCPPLPERVDETLQHPVNVCMVSQLPQFPFIPAANGQMQFQQVVRNTHCNGSPGPPYVSHVISPQQINGFPAVAIPHLQHPSFQMSALCSPTYFPVAAGPYNAPSRVCREPGGHFIGQPVFYPQNYFQARHHFLRMPSAPRIQQPMDVANQYRTMYQPSGSIKVCQQLRMHQKAMANQNSSNHQSDQSAYCITKATASHDVKCQPERAAVSVGHVGHLQSPDSGFGDALLENQTCCLSSPSASECEASVGDPSSPCEPVMTGIKRKRNPSCTNARQNGSTKNLGAACQATFLKREGDATGFKVTLEAAISPGTKADQDRLTYLNKGQDYVLVLENVNARSMCKSEYVQSTVVLIFRDTVSVTEGNSRWNFWHNDETEQALEIDPKNSIGIVEGSLRNLGINACTFSWNPQELVKAQIKVHCLSTDFSSQKGVKGLSLHIQVDTFSHACPDPGIQPIHRAYAQIKIFCDKGAERKIRDDERKMSKNKPSEAADGGKAMSEMFHVSCDKTDFYSMADLSTEPLIANPSQSAAIADELQIQDDCVSCVNSSSDTLPNFTEPELMIAPKKRKVSANEAVLIYVREEHDVAFTAVMLKSETMQSLAKAIQDKFPHLAPIGAITKKTNKGILVKMDDDMLQHFTHESMFIINMQKTPNTTILRNDIVLKETEL